MFEYYTAWKRDKLPVDKLTDKDWHLFFRSIEQQPAVWEKGHAIIRNFLSGEGTLESALKKYLPPEIKTKKLEKDLNDKLKKLLESNIPYFSDNIKKHRYLMGKLMKEYRGKISGKLVSEKLWYSINGDRHE